MAGMFYSLQEALEKLNMTEEEIKQAVADGRLREFRDGPNLLFKVEEVEALIPEAGDEALEETLEPETPEAEELEPIAMESEDLTPEDSGPAFLEPEDMEPETGEGEEAPAEEPAEAGLSDFDIEALGDTAGEIPDIESLEAEMADTAASEAAPSEEAADTNEILLAPETGSAMPSDLTDADTAITSMGTNVLGEADTSYDITDDTMAETSVPTGSAPEVPLEEIEEDVNLDSFGSGSGLLDLSLQADDTSLGGILDEIYTAEEEEAEPVEAAVEPVPEGGMAAEAEEMGAEEDLGVAQLGAQVPALARTLVEAPPDAQSNALGMLLFLPLLIVIYTTVVAVSGLRGVMPSILASIQGPIWYIMGGAAALTAVVAVAAFAFMGERDTTEKKAKPKKVKKAKEPKEKKAKKEKPKKESKARKAK